MVSPHKGEVITSPWVHVNTGLSVVSGTELYLLATTPDGLLMDVVSMGATPRHLQRAYAKALSHTTGIKVVGRYEEWAGGAIKVREQQRAAHAVLGHSLQRRQHAPLVA